VGELDGVGMAQLVEREQLRGGAHPSTDPAPGSRSSSVRVSASLMRRPGAPEQHDQSSQAGAVDTVAGLANDGDDLLHGGRIRWERNPSLGGFYRINGTKLAIVGRAVVDRRPASALGGRRRCTSAPGWRRVFRANQRREPGSGEGPLLRDKA
jgi:hypothetical protein